VQVIDRDSPMVRDPLMVEPAASAVVLLRVLSDPVRLRLLSLIASHFGRSRSSERRRRYGFMPVRDPTEPLAEPHHDKDTHSPLDGQAGCAVRLHPQRRPVPDGRRLATPSGR
jgi:hypothetical protein